MTVIITAWDRSPDGGMGLARDTRVRWALEEVGQPYEVRFVSVRTKQEPAHMRLHPFGLIPTYEEGELALFETGAIVFHIAEHHQGLFPDDRNARARAITWMFAALNTVEPPVQNLSVMDLQQSEEQWAKLRRPGAVDAVKVRLGALSAWLDGRDYLVDRFTAADVLMTTVLRLIRHTDLVAEFPVLDAYVKRCEARPAFQRALSDQMADYARNAPVAA